MTSADAPAKINLALVVGPLREDGKHEVSTVLQRIALCDRVRVSPGTGLTVTGFDDTIVTAALTALAVAGVEPAWSVEIEKTIPVAAGLGGGSSDAAVALRLANELLPEPLGAIRSRRARGDDRGGRAVLPHERGATRERRRLQPRPLDLPSDYAIVLVLPSNAVKTSTGDVYRAFDDRNGAEATASGAKRFAGRSRRVRTARDLAALPPNDLASSPLAERLRELGAFRADVSGAGPCVYGLFDDRAPRTRRRRR